jgi:hypothetical protein
MNPFDKKGCFTFGKHKGKPYSRVAFQQAFYVRWCVENIDGFKEAAEALSCPQKDAVKKAVKTARKSPKQTLNQKLLAAIERVEQDEERLQIGRLHHATAFSSDIPF